MQPRVRQRWRTDPETGLTLPRGKCGLFNVAPAFFGGSAGTTDPDFANVTLLLPLTDAAGSTTFTDVKGNTFSYINAPQTNVLTQFAGLTSVDATNASFNSTNTLFNMSTAAAWSIEMWFYLPIDAGVKALFLLGAEAPGRFFIFINGTGVLNANYFGSSSVPTCAFNVAAWNYLRVAMTPGGNLEFGCNGNTPTVYLGATSVTAGGNSPGNIYFGATSGGGQIAPALYLQQIRITRNVFRPNTLPTTPWPTS